MSFIPTKENARSNFEGESGRETKSTGYGSSASLSARGSLKKDTTPKEEPSSPAESTVRHLSRLSQTAKNRQSQTQTNGFRKRAPPIGFNRCRNIFFTPGVKREEEGDGETDQKRTSSATGGGDAVSGNPSISVIPPPPDKRRKSEDDASTAVGLTTDTLVGMPNMMSAVSHSTAAAAPSKNIESPDAGRSAAAASTSTTTPAVAPSVAAMQPQQQPPRQRVMGPVMNTKFAPIMDEAARQQQVVTVCGNRYMKLNVVGRGGSAKCIAYWDRTWKSMR